MDITVMLQIAGQIIGLLKIGVERISSLDDAIRLANKLPAATPLPENWADLIKETEIKK